MISLYYILNFVLIGIYPISRIFRLLNFFILDIPDELGTTRENSIFYTIMAFTVIKYLRSYSTLQFLSSLFFTIKVALITSYLFVDVKISLLYAGACLVIFVLCSEPKFNGRTKIQDIEDIKEFEELVGVKFRDNDDGDIIEELNERFKRKQQVKEKSKKIQNYKITEMFFAEFYVDWADTCNYTKEIWANFSCKYTTKGLKFISINLAKIPRLAECYRINTSAMSRQLPTVILFEDGEEAQRFPPIDEKTNKIPKVLKYGKKELQSYFDLEKRYLATRDL
ncbi:unnamed protein product [Paramecium sonneborni]|uniref:Thioredoxin domain-containing protein n=1 Tax=Paramecium sonneborni TaxID=65129 RepID=A0A8S1K5C6_9CILI|nr:unnamed protein product [Paramecium sonneborni]